MGVELRGMHKKEALILRQPKKTLRLRNDKSGGLIEVIPNSDYCETVGRTQRIIWGSGHAKANDIHNNNIGRGSDLLSKVGDPLR